MAHNGQQQAQAAPASNGTNGDDDDAWWKPQNWLKAIFGGGNQGGGFDLFGMILKAVIWGSVIFGLYEMVIKPNEDHIADWLDKSFGHDSGKMFKDAMGKVDGMASGAGGGLMGMIGNMFPDWANKQAVDQANKDPDKFKGELTKNGLSDGAADLFMKNKDVLIPLLAGASGDPKKPYFIGSALKDKDKIPNVLDALMTKQPLLGKQFIHAAANAPTGQSGDAKPMIAAFGQLLADDDRTRLDRITRPLLSDPQARLDLMTMISKSVADATAKTDKDGKSIAGLTLKPEKLDALMTAVGMNADGTLTDNFKTLLTNMTDTTIGADVRNQKLIEFAMSNDVAATGKAAVVDLLATAQTEDKSMKPVLALLGNTNNFDKTETLLHAIGSDDAKQILSMFSPENQDQYGQPSKDSDAAKYIADKINKDANFSAKIQAWAQGIDSNSIKAYSELSATIGGFAVDPKMAVGLAQATPPAAGSDPVSPPADGKAPAEAPAIDMAVVMQQILASNADQLESMRKQEAKFAPMLTKQAAADTKNAAMQFLADAKNTPAGQPSANLDATLVLLETLRKDEHLGKDQAHAPARTNAVVQALMDKLGGKQDALKGLTADGLVTFFQTPGNLEAFHSFIQHIHGETPEQQNLIDVLNREWVHAKSSDGGTGLNELFTDQKSVAKFLEILNAPPEKDAKKGDANLGLAWMAGLNVIYANRTDIDNLNAAMKKMVPAAGR